MGATMPMLDSVYVPRAQLKEAKRLKSFWSGVAAAWQLAGLIPIWWFDLLRNYDPQDVPVIAIAFAGLWLGFAILGCAIYISPLSEWIDLAERNLREELGDNWILESEQHYSRITHTVSR